ncbi:glycosyltransferase family 87 protein [Streptomyces sp. 378]|uniref:glycosyltransferase family 87 protein n=1 Tax=Streptomyces sp. 378 TaxID=3049412 RepID=UPI0024C3C0AE|nr:glycosyltransferase family 87 protein [Streptomyces sp. 378]MDK1343509.1 glycosyltransferase family 87 protein [Streptomyces sp. 378]
MKTTGLRRSPAWLPVVWCLTRLLLLLFVLKVYVFPGPDVTSDVHVIYQGWYGVLSSGTFPLNDVTWQYPPAAALAILSPGLLPFLDYATAFFVLICVTDAAVLALMTWAGRRPGRSLRGAWVWVIGVPLLGPTVYARYDVMVTAVAMAALLAGARHPRAMGALAAFGALLKVWPAMLLLAARRRSAWGAALVTGIAVTGVFALAMPGAFAFLTFQRDRGTEVESLGALVFHVARHFGWQGEVKLNYGSIEFLGPYVSEVSTGALFLTGAAFGWLVLWRLLARRFEEHTLTDAAFVAVLMFTTTSRVISPQYMVWLVGLAAVCLYHPGSRMRLPVLLVLVASFVTVLEFPFYFGSVVASDGLGLTLLFLRNGLLVAASLIAARALWKATVPGIAPAPVPPRPARAGETPVSP